ncbi:trypsin-like peptidase domain-containing protein [Streptomyces sp. TRM72054]|uniref:trypsin-like peptidase domain-containing protein n=1 Tax=Streptomyces sp. TRM72054 TaxID=2870562 RepID=UPI0021AB8FD3|nr:trypsin-like peptidase domain-containing protein [Streptomyces sp. TRM72054]
MAASADRGLRSERAAEIIVGLPGTGRRGSGYLVAPGRVLTAAHVVAGAVGVRVRFEADRPGERTVEASVAWAHAGIDVAVLTVPQDGDVPAVSYGRPGEQDAVLRCTALGFPRFKLRTGADGSRFRDAEHVHATCAVLSNRREGTLDLGVTPAPAEDPDPGRDAWEGMSGAAVFSGGRLVGVVTVHHRTDGPGRIAASRVDRWAEALDASQQAVIEGLLGHRLGLSALPSAAPGTGADLVQEAYRAQLADIAPEYLTGRATDLADLVSFCADREPYLWLQGPPWAGKTALAAWFALHPPRGVVPVWFFITARYASQSDSDAYTAAVIDQLATIAGRAPATTGSPTARDGERRLLLRQAAEQVARDGGTLLLVVDGLDEDQSLTPGGTGTSIASLLPERPPPNVRVLVTSRTSPGLPADVPGGHPLRTCRVAKLSATAASRHTEYEAKYDLHKALSGDRLQRDLVGLLTAARGTLTVDDLRELTGEPAYELRGRLGSAFGRILRLRGDAGGEGGSGGPEGYGDDLVLYTSTRGYLFAHETLLTAAQDELGPDLGTYLERLHAWAASYEQRGWPEGTPLYLLQPYGRLLAFLQEAGRLTDLAVDVRRRDRLLEATGSDAACLAEIVTARETVRRVAPDDLGALAALAVAGDLVAQRNEGLHPDIPAVYARLGRTRHAIGLARSVFQAADRVRALVAVARVLAETGDRRARGVAEEAVRLSRTEAKTDGAHTPHSVAAQGVLATVLAHAGRGDEAVRVLRALPLPTNGRSSESFVEALTTTARALDDPVRAAGVLRLAERAAEAVWPRQERIPGLVTVAEAWAATGFPDKADRLYDSVVGFSRRRAGAPGNLPAVAAEALRTARPHDAEALASLAVPARDEPEQFRAVRELLDAVRGLVVNNRFAEAERLADSALIERPMHMDAQQDLWSAIALGWASAGRAAQAWRVLGLGTQWGYVSAVRGLAGRTVRLLAAAGHADELEKVLLHSADSHLWEVRAEALAALATHVAPGHPERALRLLRQAEDAHRAGRPRIHLLNERSLGAFAGALAAIGRPDDAGRLLTAVGSPLMHSWGCAAAALGLARTDRGRALRFAERAVELAFAPDRPMMVRSVQIAAVQALAAAGAAERVLDILEKLPESGALLAERDRDDLWTWVVEGLWPHAREQAGRWVDGVLPGLRDASVPEVTRLLVAVGRHDPECGARIRRILRDRATDPGLREQLQDFEQALLALSVPDGCPAAAPDLDAIAGRHDEWPRHTRTAVVLALTYAALGDHEAARNTALRPTSGRERAEACVHLAAYTAGVHDEMTVVPLVSGPLVIPPIARRLAARLHPPRSGPDLPRARALLAEALTPEGWDEAAQVLAEIDPDAVLRARDVVFAHLGLDGTSPQ